MTSRIRSGARASIVGWSGCSASATHWSEYVHIITEGGGRRRGISPRPRHGRRTRSRRHSPSLSPSPQARIWVAMLEIFNSASAAERLRAAGAFIERFPPDAELLIVGASRDAADDLARRVTVTRGASFGLHRASLTQLAVRFAAAEMARLGLVPATSLGSEAVAARVTFHAHQEETLGYFAPVARLPGFARALAATLGELRLGGVPHRALEGLGDAARDLAELAQRFEAQLEDGKLVDRAALLKLATRAAAEGGLEPLHRVPIVLLDVPIEGPAERDFVQALSAASQAALVTVPAGDDATLDALRALGAQNAPGGPTDSDEPDLARVRGFLFSPAAPPPRDERGDVLFFSAPGEGRETVEIARRIVAEA